MSFFKFLAVVFFNLLDKFIHQVRILNQLKKMNMSMNIYIDVGSHKGTYTDLILRNFSVKKILMFEPQKNIFRYIQKKYSKNKKVRKFNFGVSDKNTKKKIYINKHDLTSSFSRLNNKNTYLNLKAKLFSSGDTKGMIQNSYRIKTIRLDNFLKKEKTKKIDLIKIDTEGHEFEVLTGLGSKIKLVKIILIEFHNDNVYLGYNNKKIHNYLIEKKFKLEKKIKFPFTEWEDRIYSNNQ